MRILDLLEIAAVRVAITLAEMPPCTCRVKWFTRQQLIDQNNTAAVLFLAYLLYIYTSAPLLLPTITLYP